MTEQQEQQPQPEPQFNIAITGDEARFMMLMMQSSAISAPAAAVTQLYVRLSNLAQLQPPQ